MTQEEVADKARLSREYISHLERGQYNPTIDVLIRVCAAMGVKAWKLLQQVEEGS